MLRKTIRANYKLIGKSSGYYKQGKTYWLTVEFKGWPWNKYIEVTYRHGYHNFLVPGSGAIVYRDIETFNEDWEAV